MLFQGKSDPTPPQPLYLLGSLGFITVFLGEPEKRLLRSWVASGHSVHENADSKYICLAGGSPPFDFLDVYRMDREIQRDMKGMSEAEQEAYLKAYTGWHDDAADSIPFWDEDDGADASLIFGPFVQD